MPSGMYNLDGIKKLGKLRNWCLYYLICRAVNRQVVVVDHYDNNGDGTCGGGGCGNKFIGTSKIIVAFRSIIIYYSLLPTSIRCIFARPKNHERIPAPTPNRDPSLNHSGYTRPPQESAQLFRPCVSGEFDMTPLAVNQGIIVSVHHFYSRCVTYHVKFVKTLSCTHIIAPNTTELSRDINARGPQHVVEEGCGVGVWVGPSTRTLSSCLDHRMHVQHNLRSGNYK